mmetsp:Transcript_20844/g.59465  ORF Transcript_20844/g.59465 Transcript_20844/m.59465 type:complete len:92 (+) Transcript_20844:376-651(+)
MDRTLIVADMVAARVCLFAAVDKQGCTPGSKHALIDYRRQTVSAVEEPIFVADIALGALRFIQSFNHSIMQSCHAILRAALHHCFRNCVSS